MPQGRSEVARATTHPTRAIAWVRHTHRVMRRTRAHRERSMHNRRPVQKVLAERDPIRKGPDVVQTSGREGSKRKLRFVCRTPCRTPLAFLRPLYASSRHTAMVADLLPPHDRPPDPGVDHESSTNPPEVAPRDGLSDLGTISLMDLGGSQGLSSAPGGSGEPHISTVVMTTLLVDTQRSKGFGERCATRRMHSRHGA